MLRKGFSFLLSKVKLRKFQSNWLTNWLERKLLDDELREIDSRELFSIKDNDWFKALEELDMLQTKVIKTMSLNNV